MIMMQSSNLGFEYRGSWGYIDTCLTIGDHGAI